jgi:Holliday junction resolvase RusA-like endonuclease
MTQRLTLEIPIRAIPSSNSKRISKSGRIYDAQKGKAGQIATIRLFVAQSVKDQGWKLTGEPVWMSLEFVMTRPDGHFGTGKNAGKLKPSAPRWPTAKNGDRTNLLKAVEDALTGIVWHDDAQVVDGPIRKSYGETDVIRISICELDNTLEN